MSNRRLPFLPPRWLKCPRVGSMLLDLFVPCKTPLDAKFTDAIPPEDIFDPDSLFECVRPVQLGLLVDLTKSTRFYHRREIEAHGCKYVKIACKGNEECPTEEQVKLFISLVENFEDANAGTRKKIGVHCTHGFNRTGFLIVAYLVEVQNYSLERALQLFTEARPPGIYKADYLQELYQRYDDPDDCPPAPELPDWCFEDGDHSGAPALPKRKHPDSPAGQDDDTLVPVLSKKSRGDDDEEGDATAASTASTAQRLPAAPHGQPKLMAGVTGVQTLDQASFEAHNVRTVTDHLIYLGGVHPNRSGDQDQDGATASGADQEALRTEPLSLPLNYDPMLRFRGSQPVSMTRQNARFIVDKPYAVTYKSDGTRYLMLVHGPDKVYLIDRGNFVYKVDMLQFPTAGWLQAAVQAKRNGDQPTDFMTEPGAHLVNTLLDGELVAFDNTPDRPYKFLVYDALTIQGYPCGKRPFETRLNYIEKYVVKPRNEAGHNQLVDFTAQSFSVRKKPFFRLDHVGELLQQTRETLQHETDGLIFQPAGPHDFYILGTCDETLKWKPPELNTIDFRCKVYLRKAPGEVSTYVGELYLGGSGVPNAHLVQVTSKDKALDGKIVECTCDHALRGWKVLRVRTDKTDPNHLSVGKLIMESILYPVTSEDVLTLVKMWRQACISHQREREERMRRANEAGGYPPQAPSSS